MADQPKIDLTVLDPAGIAHAFGDDVEGAVKFCRASAGPVRWFLTTPKPYEPPTLTRVWTEDQIRAAFLLKFNCGGYGEFRERRGGADGTTDMTPEAQLAAGLMESDVKKFFEYLEMAEGSRNPRGPGTGLT